MGTNLNEPSINRRQFLRVVGFSVGGAVLAPLLSAAKPVSRLSRYYRGTADGKLLGSSDGRQWTALTDFGPRLAVQAVSVARDGWVQVTLDLSGQAFVLKSRDEKTWYTQDYEAPVKA